MLDPQAVWKVLPARMPGMVPSVVAVRFPGASLHEVLRVLEEMTAERWAVRRTRKGHDVYYRGQTPATSRAPRPDRGLW